MRGTGWFRTGRRYRFRVRSALILTVFVWMTFMSPATSRGNALMGESGFQDAIRFFSSLPHRTTGSDGALRSAAFIRSTFRELGFTTVGTHRFLVPVRAGSGARLIIEATGRELVMDSFTGNAISPDTLPEPGFAGHLIHVGDGALSRFNGLDVKGSVVLMDLDSGKNWTHALSLGAGALIYIDHGKTDRFLFEDKEELTPVPFPRFVISEDKARNLFGMFDRKDSRQALPRVRLVSDLRWTQAEGENIYCLVPGTSGIKKQDLILVEGFYDTRAFLCGTSPGADQASSAASLLDLARYLKAHPPERSVMLLATSGHGQALAGMREAVWTLSEKSKVLKSEKKRLKELMESAVFDAAALERFQQGKALTPDEERQVLSQVSDRVKDRVDAISMELISLRLGAKTPEIEATIRKRAKERFSLRQVLWKPSLAALTPAERDIAATLVPSALERLRRLMEDLERQSGCLKSALALRELADTFSLSATVSLHLSSHGDGVGAFNTGWLYDLKQGVNRFAPYSRIEQALSKAGGSMALDTGLAGLYQDTLRPSYRRSWKSYFLDRPYLGGEVASLAGYPGITLVTTNDARSLWGTPGDLPETMDLDFAQRQSRCVSTLIGQLASADHLAGESRPGDGFATLKIRANFIRHGELFAEAPAPGSVIMAFQGPGIYYGFADPSGLVTLKGLATKKQVLDKVIIEGYRFDESGRTVWAIDKKKTSKDGYRVKMKKARMETDLVMFQCRGTTLTDLLEPRGFRYMTRINLLDGRLDATPARYWYSRIDTRSSTLNSIYLESGTRLKLTLSDTLLTHRLILTGSDGAHPMGTGYRVDDHPVLGPTGFLAARDMWALLNPRIRNLETKGIHSPRILGLQKQGNEALAAAEGFLHKKEYDVFYQRAGEALALAGRVYDHVEKTQKDVLFGVLFYIALFVPFAFCLERFLFGAAGIYKRIGAFLGILLVLIAVIYQVHPAFELAYSPLVVILAFFIMGLSVMVSWIVISRFESEVQQLRRRGVGFRHEEIGLFKAFMASFFMGINNLRRRRLRTILTCATLVILTFTIMSFTTVKTVRRHARLDYSERSPYTGVMVKKLNWQGLPTEAAAVLQGFSGTGIRSAVRGVMESGSATETVTVPLVSGTARGNASGVVGLSHTEASISGMDRILDEGRWFLANEHNVVLISRQMADQLGVSPGDTERCMIRMWSLPFKVVGIFSGSEADRFLDLDGEPLSPVIFPDEVVRQTTEAEMDALESGDDVQSFQSRYRHVPFSQTVIIPWGYLASLGGSLKSVAFAGSDAATTKFLIAGMLDRFGLWVFSGDRERVSLYTASDSLSYGGLPSIAVPVLIAMFIVLNTMIGSVHERRREIGIYTSVGMAPYHVAILFMAEALAYAVLSVVLGYVAAQVSARLFADTWLFQGITVNYSSVAGVAAMILVMLVVALSSIYPSRMASAIAIPDVEKTWSLSKPEGNRLFVDLPFLIAPGEDRSVAGYLFHFLSAHQEVSHGHFSVDDLVLNTSSEAGSQVEGSVPDTLVFNAWLAPFDFGIMQAVEMRFGSSQVQEGFRQLTMAVTRKSGEANTWWRVNRRFINLIRKQVLIWRAMDTTGKSRFEQKFSTIDREPEVLNV